VHHIIRRGAVVLGALALVAISKQQPGNVLRKGSGFVCCVHFWVLYSFAEIFSMELAEGGYANVSDAPASW
jgi:hypothetical protein